VKCAPREAGIIEWEQCKYNQVSYCISNPVNSLILYYDFSTSRAKPLVTILEVLDWKGASARAELQWNKQATLSSSVLAPSDKAFRNNPAWQTAPRGLLVVQRYPPFGNDFLDA
jgi:hypothetical protein